MGARAGDHCALAGRDNSVVAAPGVPRAGVARIRRLGPDWIEVTDRWGDAHVFPAVVATCQAWLLSTEIDCDESLFSQDMWMALDRTRYMQSSKTFVMVDRPFGKT